MVLDWKNTTRTDEDTSRYKKVARILARSEWTRRLYEELTTLRNKAVPHQYFYLVDGPSGIGKTQLPFTMEAKGLVVCHLLLTLSQTLQNIYQPLREVSCQFQIALNSDLVILNPSQRDDPQLSSDALYAFPTPLHTVAFIFASLGVRLDQVRKFTVRALSRYVQSMTQEHRPVYFLDEVLPLHTRQKLQDSDINRLRLARNLLRAVGLVVVLMGTNSSAANFADLAIHSRTSLAALTTPWCKVITRLSPATLDSLAPLGVKEKLISLDIVDPTGNCRLFFNSQFRTCIPWFVEIFVQAISALEPVRRYTGNVSKFMDKLLCAMSTTIFQSKDKLRSMNGLRGQYNMHLTTTKFPTTTREGGARHKNPAKKEPSPIACPDTASLVSNHFAWLNAIDPSLYLRDDHLWIDPSCKNVWENPPASFKRAIEDSLFYLLLGGGKGEHFPKPFAFSSNPYTTLHTKTMLDDETRGIIRGVNSPNENSSALHRCGDLLESMASVAIEMSSHQGGVRGILVSDFLLCFLRELLPSSIALEWKEEAGPSRFLTSTFLSQRIPFLSTANDPWPQTLKDIPGTNFGDFNRAENAERIDVKIFNSQSQIIATAEMKNYETALNGETIVAILQRCVVFPPPHFLHLVPCSRVQEKYFSKTGRNKIDEARKINTTLDQTAILKVAFDSSQVCLKPLFVNSCPTQLCTRAVIFYPIENIHDQYHEVKSLVAVAERIQSRPQNKRSRSPAIAGRDSRKSFH